MKKRSNFVILAFVVSILLVASASFGGKVAAEPAGKGPYQSGQPTPTPVLTTPPTSAVNRTVTLNDLGYSNDETVQGVTVSRTYSVRWPASWTVMSGNAITIDFSHSSVLASYSSMAADFNDIRIGSVILSPENTDHGSIRFFIPNNIIKVGYNALTLQFYMGIHDNYCDDLENPGVWATIHNDSFFNISYQPSRPVPDLSLFPSPILNKSELLVNQLTIVVPDQPSVAELGAIAAVSTKLGQLNGQYNFNINVMPYSKASGPGSSPVFGNLMYIGRADHLGILSLESFPFVSKAGETINFVALDGRPLNPDNGVLWEDVSPNDPTAVRLIVTGQTDNALTKAARGLANETVYPLLRGQLGIVQVVTKPSSTAETIKPTMTFSDLGYTDETARGTFRQTINYVIPLSREWQVYTEASLNLHFAHSQLLYPQGSILTVLINDTPVGSDLLTPENAENGQVTYKIPARLFKIGSNTISITTDTQLPYDPQDQYFCNKDNSIEAWVTVYADSTLNLPGGPTALVLNLSNYPFGFTGAADFSDLAFVVPPSSGTDVSQAIAWIGAGLGRFATGPELSPQVVSADKLSAGTSAPPYQILLGQPSQNPAIYQLNDVLPLAFVEGQNVLQNPNLVAQIFPSSGSGSIGYIQAALLDNGQPRLVVSGSSEEGMLWAANALYDPNLSDELKGDLALLNSPNSIYTATIKQPNVLTVEAAPTPAVESPIQTISVSSTSWIIWLAAGVFLVTVLIIVGLLLSPLLRRRTQ